MSNSNYIAGLMGPVFLVIGLSMLLNHQLYPALVDQIAANYGLIFFAGMVALVAGIAIVRAHNVWEASWRVIVTILGWLTVIGGVTRMIIPDRAAAIARTFVDGNLIMVAAVVMLALGAFLSFKAYVPER